MDSKNDSCKEITNIGLQSIGETIEELSSLKEIYLEFYR